MATLVTYDRYTELLGKHIHRTITPAEHTALASFEAAHREPDQKVCPKCGANIWTFLEPYRVAHDLAKCPGKPGIAVPPAAK